MIHIRDIEPTEDAIMNEYRLTGRCNNFRYFIFLFFLVVVTNSETLAMQQITPSEQMLYSTVKITTLSDDGTVETGTGFFFDFVIEGSKFIPTIVTNKHVMEGADRIKIVFHIAEQGRPSGQFVTYDIGVTSGSVFNHPDPNVDLCAIPIANILLESNTNNKPIFAKAIRLDVIPPDEDWQYFDVIEDVTMIGYPRGISDETNNLPVVRRGITATSLGKPYNGKQEFMVDMACFPGSSGSPVFLYNSGMYIDRRNNSIIAGERLYFVGVLHAGPTIGNDGQIVLAQQPKIYVPTMMHLGYVIRSTQLRVLDAEIRRLLTDEVRKKIEIDSIAN